MSAKTLVNTYDSKCYELADYFLPEAAYDAHLRHSLALAIQEAIEDWFQALDLPDPSE